jgi:hypothetical protein
LRVDAPGTTSKEAAMHVLVTDAHFGASDRLVQRLQQLDVRVTRCHDQVGYCRALQLGARCPLDDLGTVDLVVDVRGTGDELTAREYGVVCGERARRPVWIVGSDPDVPVTIPAAVRDIAIPATEQEFLTRCQARRGPVGPQ